jgi:integrase
MSRKSKNSKPSRATKIPPLRLHKASGQGYVLLSGRRIYLGKHGSSETRQKYLVAVREWEANGRTLPVPPDEITVVELTAGFWRHAEGYYRKADGTPTGELDSYKSPIKLLKNLYGHTGAVDFGPRALKAVRHEMISRGNVRTTINKNIGRIRNIFRWAVSEELIPPTVHQALATVANLKRGRSEANESEKVPPVPEADISAVLPLLSRQVAGMVRFQLLTGARPGDVAQLRFVDIDTSGAVWQYRPQTHKTEHYGHERIVYIGPDAQKVLGEFMDRPITSYVFSPAEAETERRAALHAARKTPLSCGNRPGTNKKRRPKRPPSERYTTGSYRRAVQRALKKAGIDNWHPHQLRHNRGTEVRKAFGLEASKIVLGLKTVTMAELYSERDEGRAMEITEKMG